MDIQRESVTTKSNKLFYAVLTILLVVAMGAGVNTVVGNASFIVDQHKLFYATVKKGDFTVNVRATGVLKPDDIHWVSTQVAGRVEDVAVKPGDSVNTGDVLVTLSNPNLVRDLQTAKWELQASKAESHASFTSLQSQLLDLKNAVVAAEYQYQSAKLRLDAETILIEQGNAAVSHLDYQKSQVAVKQQHQFWQAQKQKLTNMQVNIEATKTAQQARIGLVDNNYQRILEQVEALTVRAGKSGVVQQVPLQLGARASVGDSVALIADQQSLFAELEVQQVRARDLRVGQPVNIDTRTSNIKGSVARIAPAVKDGMVVVDVALAGELPDEARPELTIDGLIEISNIPNTLFVNRPMFAPRNTSVELYKLSADKHFANKQQVKLGQSSVNQIQVLSGLNPGDVIVVSDTTSWTDHQQVLIN